ncbi:ABC transporter ATP-binding protein [Haladaptatus sp. NG-SE-30]
MTNLVLDGLTKTFDGENGEVLAASDIDITADDGEFLVLVGPSGCGKTTTLRCIAGLETVTDGSIVIDGNEVTDTKPKDRDIAMVFQSYALYPQKTVRGNMRFGLEMTTKLSDDEIEDRVRSAASMLDIGELLDRKPNALSGGQKQRVALGRAIVRDPEVFLMDEPLSNLDAKLRTQMRTELQELHDDLDATIVYVTHDQTEAMTMGDRIAVLDGGELQQVGTPLECYYEPANRFVAGFIGSPSMNFIDLEATEDGHRALGEDIDYSFSDAHAEAIRSHVSGNRITLGIRPEDIVPAEVQGDHVVSVSVNVVEPMGKETILHFELDGREMTASISGDYVVDAMDTLLLRFPEEKIHVFDAVTGETIFNCGRSNDQLPGTADF